MADPFVAPLPPWARFESFLAPDEEAGLLAWTLANEERFTESKVWGGTVDPARRISRYTTDLGPHGAILEARIAARLDDMFRAIGTRPFVPEYYELELVAHGDGAHFGAHTDIPIGAARARLAEGQGGTNRRLLSGVYYFYREPKAFDGGALRLYRLAGGDGPEDRVDVEPVRNSLVVFPTWALHEVRPVRCPSGAFPDSRFAVNVWLCRTLS
ncbi:MAG: 2OG-Fe(II) oxygenase [Alphaproteobacteria bacterium]|nr:2OG-Fe(II) oxygenase [Alphaproteobacteria bacterium]